MKFKKIIASHHTIQNHSHTKTEKFLNLLSRVLRLIRYYARTITFASDFSILLDPRKCSFACVIFLAK